MMRHPSGFVGPALAALVTDVQTAQPISLHRTWIRADGSGKAPIHPPRLFLVGHRSNGVCRIFADDEVSLGLILAEGIESSLAGARAGFTPVWATLSAGNLARFPVLPRRLEGLTVLVDNDAAGIDAANKLITRYVRAGFDPERDIKIVMSPTPGEDAADLEQP